MKIFRIRLDSNVFQSFLPVDTAIWQTDTLKMDCQPKSVQWKPPEVYVHSPKRKRGNFFHFCSGALVADSSAIEALRSTFEMAGELLPLEYNGVAFHLLNVLECISCLDDQRTKWVTGKTTGAKIRIVEYHFNKSRLSESTIFKIPETSSSEILCVEGLKDPEDEFKFQVESNEFTGLIFERLWSDEN